MATPDLPTGIPPAIQKKLYDEADARFWAQTGYSPGKKLDPKNPLDRKMIPTYYDIYRKVVAEWRAGKVIWSHDNPTVVSAIAAAAQHTADAIGHIATASQAIATGLVPTSQDVQKPLADAHASHVAAQQATAVAAAHQPPTVDPGLAAKASHETMHFVMNGSQGVRVDPETSVAAMQATAAPAKAAAQTADTQEQADAAATHADAHPHKKLGEEIAIGAAVLATIGLVVFAVKGKGTMRGRPHASHTFRTHHRRRIA